MFSLAPIFEKMRPSSVGGDNKRADGVNYEEAKRVSDCSIVSQYIGFEGLAKESLRPTAVFSRCVADPRPPPRVASALVKQDSLYRNLAAKKGDTRM